jgi:hypothetical protein
LRRKTLGWFYWPALRLTVLVAVTIARCHGHRYGADGSVLEAAGGWWAVESGDLGLVETLGKRGELSLGVWIERVGGGGGVGSSRGGVWRLVAAGEQTG